jgi:hypothetical protein
VTAAIFAQSEADALREVRMLMEQLQEQQWTDGLPVIPPARAFVEEMMATTSADPQTVVAMLDPAGAAATVEAVAANAVMAGCRPEYFPYVLAAVEAVANPRFNLRGNLCSTHISHPLVIINGPSRDRHGVNYRGNCFGQGFRANATIGRALNLSLVNIAGAIPQVVDRAIFGHPGKFSYCIGENEEASPWDPLHVTMGLLPNDDAVTVYAAEPPHSIIGLCFQNPQELLDICADSMAQAGLTHYYVGGDVLLIFGPAHAQILADARWTRADVQTYLHERTRKPISLLKLGGIWGREVEQNRWPKWVNRADDSAQAPLVREPHDLKLLVAGGPGAGSSAFVPGWGTRCSTVQVGKWAAAGW